MKNPNRSPDALTANPITWTASEIILAVLPLEINGRAHLLDLAVAFDLCIAGASSAEGRLNPAAKALLAHTSPARVARQNVLSLLVHFAVVQACG